MVAVVALGLCIGFGHVFADLGLAVGLGALAVVHLRLGVNPNLAQGTSARAAG